MFGLHGLFVTMDDCSEHVLEPVSLMLIPGEFDMAHKRITRGHYGSRNIERIFYRI